MFVLCILLRDISGVTSYEIRQTFAFTFRVGIGIVSNFESDFLFFFCFFFVSYNFVWFESKSNSIDRKCVYLVFNDCLPHLLFSTYRLDRSWKGTLQQQHNPFHGSSYIAFFFVTWMNCSLNFTIKMSQRIFSHFSCVSFCLVEKKLANILLV